CSSHLVVFSFKGSFVLCPHGQDDLDGFAQALQSFARIRIGIAVGAILLFVPARANTEIEPTMTEGIDGAGDLCQQRGVAVTVTGHKLSNANTLRIARQGCRAAPAFK